MVEIERLTVSLPTPMANSMRAAVESGEYATPSEVIATRCGCGQAAASCGLGSWRR
jgi:hypothetical protein